MKEDPSMYCIIPTKIMRDKRLSLGARLLYGEITSLSNQKGFCWASNDYFAELYDSSKRSISRWIAELNLCEYISVEIICQEGTKIIENRIIRLLSYHEKTLEGIFKKREDNIRIPKENKVRPQKVKKGSIIKEVVKKKDKFVIPEFQDVEIYFGIQSSTRQNAEKFFDYYTSNNWKVGRNPMKDWYASARNWIKRDLDYNNSKPKQENADLKRKQTGDALDAAFEYLNR